MRAFVAEAVYGVLRRKRTLERLCGPEAQQPRHLILAWLARVEGTPLRNLEALHGRDKDFFTDVKARTLPEPTLAENADLP